jgi:GNAT superfamily N-acetyltransferase
MYWRLSHAEFEKRKGDKNKRAFKRLVASPEAPGVLAYARGEPVGWCAVAPRQAYPRLARSRILKPVDDRPVWSIVCLFVARAHRRTGVSVGLLRAAAQFAAAQGAQIVEGYPVDPRDDRMPDAFAFHGTASAFEQAGFREVARRSATRPVMRWHARG